MYALLCKKCHQLLIIIKHKYTYANGTDEWERGQLQLYKEHTVRHRISHQNTFKNLSKRVYYLKLR